MDIVFEGLVTVDILCVMLIIFMIYNRIRGKDELHGIFGSKPKHDPEAEDA